MSQSHETSQRPRRHSSSVDRGVFIALGAAAGLLVVALVLTGVVIAMAARAASRSPESAGASSGGSPKATSSRPSPTPVSSAKPPVTRPPSAEGTVSIAAVGDMLFGRSTAELIAKQGGAAPLADVAPLLAGADIAIGNLEGAISTAGVEAKWKDVRLRGDPRAVLGLQLAGFDVVSLANNHSFDFGWPAVRDTLATLAAARVGASGAGEDTGAAWKPVVVTRRGSDTAVLSFTRVLPSGFGAGRNHPGMASAYQEQAVVRAIRDAKKRYGRVVAQFHWGVEYADRPNASQVELAHHAIDAGADLVVGHHPHVIQGLERYKGKLIAYSLGDFVFEHYSTKTGEAFILSAEVGPHGIANVTVVPVYLDQQGKPSVVQGKVAQRILGRLRKLSKARGLELRIVGDRGVVAPGV